MLTKNITAEQFKFLDDTGSFRAVFSTFDFNEPDKHGDITLPGSFTDGEKVKIAAWGHDWGALPVGRGVIHSDNYKAWVDGKFFIDTTHGLDTYNTIKGLAELNQWSYGFDVIDSEIIDGHRVLKKLKVHEVSPVLIGAGNHTGLESIKSYRHQDAKTMLLELQALKHQGRDYQLLNEIRRLKMN